MQLEEIIYLIFIGAISVIVRSPCLFGDFVHDDLPTILWNPDVITNKSNWTSLFSHDIVGRDMVKSRSNFSHDFYRPLTVLSYRLNYSLLGNASSNFHLVNTMVQLVNCWLVYFVVKKMEQSTIAALFTASIFSVHPVLTDTVCGLTNRGSLLSGFFTLITLLVYQKNTILAIFTICLGILAKEESILIILLNISIQIIKRERITHTLFVYGSFLALVMSLRHNYFSKPEVFEEDNPIAFIESSFLRRLNFNYILSFSFSLMIWPQWMCYNWSMNCIGKPNSCLV